MTRVLVCGGRRYGVTPRAQRGRAAEDQALTERGIMRRELKRAKEEGATVLIAGGANGADAYCERWAAEHGLHVVRFRADWDAHGPAAGPIRNARMIAEGKPDLVIAFPGGRGTADCVRQAKAAGIPVRGVDGPETQKPASDRSGRAG